MWGAAGQTLLLVLLGMTTGLGAAGWLTGLGFTACCLGRPHTCTGPGGQQALRSRQRRHPGPHDARRGCGRAGRRLLREPTAGRGPGRARHGGADPRCGRRPGRPAHRDGVLPGGALRHGSRRLPHSGAQRPRRHVAGRLGAADRRHALRIRRGGPATAVVAWAPYVRAWPARRWPPCRGSFFSRSAPGSSRACPRMQQSSGRWCCSSGPSRMTSGGWCVRSRENASEVRETILKTHDCCLARSRRGTVVRDLLALGPLRIECPGTRVARR